jgi:hypothetical protein
MTRRWIVSTATFVLIVAVLGGAMAFAGDAQALPSLDDKTAGLERQQGLFTIWQDSEAGKVWLKLPPANERGHIARVLYIDGLARGLGSNPVGLDRGKLGSTVVLDLRRLGGKVLFEQPNLMYRALTDDPDEVAAVEESFATSVLWAAPVAAIDADGSCLIDLTSFLVRDAFGAGRTLQSAGQGTYRLDESRSVVDLGATLVFPRNLEFEAVLTFSGSEPGRHVRSVAPDAQSVSLIQHHSLVALPEPGYRPRPFDPRAGSFAIEFADYAAPLDISPTRRWIVRHRLEKIDPSRQRSRVKEPIVYYVDRGAPEPVRQALIDGASWWAQAFDAAGFVDAFRVELLPPDAHPLDARYNVIQWVHRSTRGWSYGGGVTDPRTGEMIKGHVSLGSLRVRQDRLLFEGLLGTGKTGTGDGDDPVQLALARIRQLSAHEVGHTLGLTHNFAASTYGRASVMDYPAPLVRLAGDGLDVSQAYAVGVGAWDRHAIRFAYGEFSPGTAQGLALDTIVQDGIEAGLLFLSDDDARPAGAAHPLANLWDNGEDPIAELRNALDVRRWAIQHFGTSNVAPGTPLALLEEVFATVYLHHRYQLDAAVKSVGGVDYRYALAGDGQPGARAVPAARQLEALSAVLSVLDPKELDIPEAVLATLLPRPFGYGQNRELFNGRTQPLFDALGAAETAAAQAVGGLLHPERSARLVDQHRRDASLPGLQVVLDELFETAFGAAEQEARLLEIRRRVRHVAVQGLLRLHDDARASSSVRAIARATAESWSEKIARASDADAHDRFLVDVLQRALERPSAPREADPSAPTPPPGSPIGCGFRAPLQMRP